MRGKVAKALRRISEQLFSAEYNVYGRPSTKRQIYRYLKKMYKVRKYV